MRGRSWIVLGSLSGLVICPVLVALAAVLVRDLRDPVFQDQGIPMLVISGTIGIVLGGFVTSRVVRPTPRRLTLLGSLSGSVLGAAALGSLFLLAQASGSDGSHGLAAFLIGASVGAVAGGILGGVIGFAQGTRESSGVGLPT